MYRVFFVLLIFLSTFSFGYQGGNRVIKDILDNNAVVLFKQTQGKGIIAGTIFVKGGSIEDPEGKKGLTNLTFKLLLKGTKNYDFSSFHQLFEDSGGYISASAGDEYSTIEFAVKVEDLEEALKRIKDMLFNPLFPEDKLTQEKINTIAQIKAKKEEGFSYALDELRKEIYKGTPYQYSTLGEIQDIEKIKIEDIKRRWNEILEGGRFVISIVGDTDYQSIKPLIKETFSKLKKSNYKYPSVDVKIKGKDCKTLTREGAQTTIVVAYNAPKAKEKYYFPFKVLNGILGNGFTSRLFQELREKRGLAYAVGSFYPTRINVGNLFVYMGTAPQNTEKALEGIYQVVNSIKNGVSEEEIKTAKEKFIGHYLLDHQTRAKQSWYIGWFEVVGFGYEMDEKYVDFIKKVKEEDIKKAWAEYIPEGSFCVIVKP